MTTSPVREQILEALESMSESELKRVMRDIEALRRQHPKAATGKEFLERTQGWLSDDDAEEMKRIIEEECETVDLNDW